jgi:hypothetical protein
MVTDTGRMRRIAIATIAAATCWLALGASQAAATYKFERQIGAGLLVDVHSMSVGPTHVFVGDHHVDRISVFELNGTFDGDWGVGGTAAGQIDEPVGLAATSGDNVYEADLSSFINKFKGSDGTPLLSFAGPGSAESNLDTAAGVALSPDEQHVYALSGSPSRVKEYTAGGTFERKFGSSGLGPGQIQSPRAIAVSPLTGNVYVADFGDENKVVEYGPNGMYLRHWGLAIPPVSLAVDYYGNVYVVDDAGELHAFSATGTELGLVANTGHTIHNVDSASVVAISPGPDPKIYVVNSSASPEQILVFHIVYPQTTITSGPAEGSHINDSTPTFKFSSSESGSTFQCRLSFHSFHSCSSPFTPHIGDGFVGEFDVRAIDKQGVVDPSPATRSFAVDTTPPNTTIASGPSGPTTDNTPTWTFYADEGPSTLQCKIDAGSYASCNTGSYTSSPLADGTHTFDVRAIDAAGNKDATPATHTIYVGATTPDTTITSGPSGLTNDSTPTFGFSSTVTGSTFRCTIDALPPIDCTSPTTLSALPDGDHTISVQARFDSLSDATPANRVFTIDTGAPKTTLTKKPGATTHDRTPKFKFTSTETGTFECKLDDGNWKDCTSPHTTRKLSVDKHKFKVRATDAAGNEDGSPAKSKFKVKR